MESDIITFYDRDYKRTCASIGWALISFIAVYNLLSILTLRFADTLDATLVYKWSYTLSEIIHIVIYLSSFLIPAFFLRFLLKRQGIFNQPSYSLSSTPSRSLLLIPGIISVAMLVAAITSIVMAYFGVLEAYQSLVVFEGKYEGYQIVLLYISSALVPAFCEEFLFRGTILANLMPYGKRGALIISAVLFGLMHENPYQIIYTTVAGLMLGMAYIKTNSIWLPTLIHFCNNAYSCTCEVIYANVEPALANGILIALRILLLLLGGVSIALYLIRESKASARRFDDGFFGRDIELDPSVSEKPISDGMAVKGFFRASTIIYIVATVISMIMVFINLLIIANSGAGMV